MLARLSRYHFPPEQLSVVMKMHWTAVEADPFIYERDLLAAFVFTNRDSGETVGLTIADAAEALRCTHTEPGGAVPEEVHDYEVVETFAIEPREGGGLVRRDRARRLPACAS